MKMYKHAVTGSILKVNNETVIALMDANKDLYIPYEEPKAEPKKRKKKEE